MPNVRRSKVVQGIRYSGSPDRHKVDSAVKGVGSTEVITTRHVRQNLHCDNRNHCGWRGDSLKHKDRTVVVGNCGCYVSERIGQWAREEIAEKWLARSTRNKLTFHFITRFVNEEEDGGELAVYDELEVEPAKKISEKAARKLHSEMPVVSSKALPTSRAQSASQKNNTEPGPQLQTGDSENVNWLSRTNIVLKPHDDSTRSYRLALKGQTASIKAVIDLARKTGTVDIVTDGSICPLGKGIKRITANALVKAADALGYTGEGDIAHRLEDGDLASYVKPLVKYCTQRIILERKTLKAHSDTILAALELDNSPDGIAQADALIKSGNYIYPRKTAQSSEYDYLNPFMHDVVAKYISAAFFGKTKYAKMIAEKREHIFSSSVDERPLELELPKAMVVMAGCVIHAVLEDHSRQDEDKFPPAGLDRKWEGYFDILNSAEKSNKWRFHKLMHELYLKASHSLAPATHGLTTEQIVKRIPWDAFAEMLPDDPSSTHVTSDKD
ncbi:hypothetical protein K435DRAFT_801978 [Dendrothele bispora CBS 962.96]|uniref:DUF6532 domain-containing protein n=1 Tax=Dendrothele bispora (strain CBS 962.96) TaxID=1314807 RepID=A0A4V4HEB3_DENBC|nr:hypothetical protein K435DRAFT_801978 [Dendrothele bispora CBS 962.96]